MRTPLPARMTGRFRAVDEDLGAWHREILILSFGRSSMKLSGVFADCTSSGYLSTPAPVFPRGGERLQLRGEFFRTAEYFGELRDVACHVSPVLPGRRWRKPSTATKSGRFHA